MSNDARNPLWRPSSIVLAMISLSIGWGIRGNFGHEFGAMLAGFLCAVAVCVMSGREDWQRRVLFFAFFGAIGWGFGGSMSYMQVVSYTHSGHWPSQLYGFFGVFAIGFLWSAMGGAGTAYPAVESRERLTAIFKPLLVVFFLWGIFYFIESPMDVWYKNWLFGPQQGWEGQAPDQRWFRQKSPFYWLDADWIQALLALVAVCLYDLWDRWAANEKGVGAYLGELVVLVLLPVLGAVGGAAVQSQLDKAGYLDEVTGALVQPMGDVNAPIYELYDENGVRQDITESDFVTNWPQFFSDISDRLGWLIGLLVGIAVYFAIYGTWRSGSSLILHMALGWYFVFLLLPVLLSTIPLFDAVGGFRMTPPRSDNWAGMLGLWLGTLVYMYRNKLVPVNYASIVCGLIGGVGLMFTQFLKLMLMSVGSPVLVQDPAKVEFWKHWQSANWHSIVIEQGVGLFYGLGLLVAMALLLKRTRPVTDEPPVRRWTEGFSAFFLLNVLLYVNLVKIVNDFTSSDGRPGGFRSVPEFMKMPLIQSIELSAWSWFSLVWLALTLCTVALLVVHMRRPLELVPKSWTGKGQLIYLIFLWAIVIGNVMKAVVSFGEQRIATEGTIFINAIIVTFLILAFARGPRPGLIPDEERFRPNWAELLTGGLAGVIACAFIFFAGARVVWGDHPTTGDLRSSNMRFGDHADWYVKPNLKNKAHR